MTPLLLIRHGATAWNDERPDAGPRRPRPLGRGAAPRSRRWRLPAAWAEAPLADEPAAPGARDRGAADRPARSLVEPRLIEMDWGAWEGRARRDLRAEAPAELAAQRGAGARSPAARRREPARGLRAAAGAGRRARRADPAPGRRGLPQGRDPRRAGARDRLGHAQRAAAAAAAAIRRWRWSASRTAVSSSRPPPLALAA